METRKPHKLTPGMTVGVVTPSAPLAGLLPERFERSLSAIKELGFKVRESAGARAVTGYLAGTPESRADDINQFLCDPEVDAIFCTIGGLHYNQLLRHIDFEAAAQNPKVFLGYSDATVLQLAFWARSRLVTFSGPACMTQFAEYPAVYPYTEDYLLRAISQSDPIGEVAQSKEWTEEILDWFAGVDTSRARKCTPNAGWRWLNKGSATGKLMGGCLSSMLHLAGTEFWPEFDDTIFFLDIPEGHDLGKGLSISEVDMYMTDLENLGVFNQVAGAVIGRPFGYSAEERDQFNGLLDRHFGHHDYPVLVDIDYGHTDPLITIPIGVTASLDAGADSFRIEEAGVI